MPSRSPHPADQQRRRRSSSVKQLVPLDLDRSAIPSNTGATSGLTARGSTLPLPPIPATPDEMSLSRSPSPRAGGGWASPGLTSNFDNMNGRSSPRKMYPDLGMNGGASGSGSVTWASAKARSDEVNGYPSFSTRSNGFFSRHARRISHSLPKFNLGGKRDYSDKEKLGRGRWYPSNGSRLDRLKTFVGSITRRMRLRIFLVILLVLSIILFYITREYSHPPCRRTGLY